VADTAQALSMAEKLRQTAMRVTAGSHEGKSEHITISLGIHLVDAHEDMETALQHCDKALYLAKQSGRNRSVVYRGAQPRVAVTAAL
jgi:diguanylate cyclase (GGDEF)-like protein